MKICAVICEYNPFHNGHKYQLEQIKRQSGCDKILCLMSGNFTQRGDAAVFGKYTRAMQAAENGADVVLELPAVFACSPAELFAGGAIHILSSIPAVTTLAFGCESGTAEEFFSAAKATLSEDKQFKQLLKENMADGTSYVKARTKTTLALHKEINENLLVSPNNILGTEYCRAILAQNAAMEVLPIPRIGSGFGDPAPKKNYSSATALRACLNENTNQAKKILKTNLPKNVYAACKTYRTLPYPQAALCALLRENSENVVKCPDCSEGLENKLRAMTRSVPVYDAMVDNVVSKRYTRSRLKRILLQNFLGITRKDARAYLSAPLYYNVLAIKKKNYDELLAVLSQGAFPVLARKSDFNRLKKDALGCFETDVRANDLYNVLSGTRTNEFETQFV